jgi:hypothetical protein
MIKRKILFIMAILYITPQLFGNNGVSLNIRFFDKILYYPDSSIEIKVELKNQSNGTYSFKVADFKEYNMHFRVMDMRNRDLPLAEEYSSQFQSSQPYFYRDVNLRPGEEFSFVIKLKDYVSIDEAGEYLIEAEFFPELNQPMMEQGISLTSNRILLSVRPPLGGRSEAEDQIISESQDILRAENKSPDQVISYVLEARQLDQWNRFFLYIDIPALLRQNPAWERQYINSTEEEQIALLESFKASLIDENILDFENFIERPDRFEILQTSYTPELATVKVREYFRSSNRDFTIVRDYSYYLRKNQGIWKIERYESSNIRTE